MMAVVGIAQTVDYSEGAATVVVKSNPVFAMGRAGNDGNQLDKNDVGRLGGKSEGNPFGNNHAHEDAGHLLSGDKMDNPILGPLW